MHTLIQFASLWSLFLDDFVFYALSKSKIFFVSKNLPLEMLPQRRVIRTFLVGEKLDSIAYKFFDKVFEHLNSKKLPFVSCIV